MHKICDCYHDKVMLTVVFDTDWSQARHPVYSTMTVLHVQGIAPHSHTNNNKEKTSVESVQPEKTLDFFFVPPRDRVNWEVLYTSYPIEG